MQRRCGASASFRRPRAQDRAVRRVRVDEDVGEKHQHFLLIAQLLAVGLHREAERHQPHLLERVDCGALFRHRTVIHRKSSCGNGQKLVLELACRGDDRQLVLRGALGEHARNEQAVDLVGAFENPVDARVAVVTFGRIIADEAVAAVDLHVLVEDVVHHLAAGDLRDRGFNGVLFQRGESSRTVSRLVRSRFDPCVDVAGGPVHHALHGVRPRRHLSELVLDCAERRDGLTELLTLGRIFRRLADRDVGASAAHAAKLEAAEIQNVERDLVPLPDLAEQILRRHAHVLKNQRRRRGSVQTELVLFFSAADSRERALDDERGEMFSGIVDDLREDDEEIREAAVGNPHLLAVQHEAAVGLPLRSGFRAEGVGSRTRFAERVRADELAGQEPRQVFLFLRLRAEEDERQNCEVGLSAERGAERRRSGEPLADENRGHFIELDAAVRLRDVDAQEPELAAALHERPGEGPVLLLEPIELRQDLLDDEFFGGLADHALFVGELLWREHGVGIGWLEQPRAAAQDRSRCFHISSSCDYVRSKIPAAPIPPPTHMLTRPYRAFRRLISYNNVVVSFAPVQPSGCPRAIAPPLTFRRSASIGSSFRHASTWAANASFSSTRSI